MSRARLESIARRLQSVLDGTLTLVIGGESTCQISFWPFERTSSLILEERSEDLVLTVVSNSASREDRGDRLPYRHRARPEIRTISAVVENERRGQDP